jgi:hypothetical protein
MLSSQKGRRKIHGCHGRVTDLSHRISNDRLDVFEFELNSPAIDFHPLGLGPRFPRQGLMDRFWPIHLASQFCVGEVLANDLTNTDVEALRVSHLPIVESERLLINIAKQVTALR